MRRLFQVLLVGLFVVAMCATVQAATIAQHVGSTDPTTEGFTLTGTAGVGVNDGGTQALHIDQAWGRYDMLPSPAQEADMATNGWVVEQTVRMGVAGLDVGADSNLVGLSAMEVAPSAAGTDAYLLCLGTDGSGNPTVWQYDYTFPSPWYWQIGTVSGTGYHNYELVQTAGAATANLYVDGSLMAALNPTGAFGVTRYLIGNTGSSAYTASMGVYLAGASLSTIPEPSTLALLMIGLFGLLAYAWRKRR